jgi:hypothetical protein
LALAILPDSACFNFFAAVFHLVLVFEVTFEVFRLVKKFATWRFRGATADLAAEGLVLKVLTVFMSLPVRFRAEALVALGVCAAVWPGVAFQVLSHVAWT